MIKILVSKTLKQSFQKIASDWLEKMVWHRTPTGKRNLVKVKSLTPEEQEKYRPHPKYQSMSIDSIQSHLYDYQKHKSLKAFNDLYKNFQPMIMNIVKQVIGGREPPKEDIQDLVQAANLIFVSALERANPEDKGVISYLEDTIRKQLVGQSRKTFRNTVTIGNKDRRLQRAIFKYINHYVKQHGKEPTDYDQMARDINKNPAYRVDNADAQRIQDLLQSQSVSIDTPIGDEDEKAGALIDVLGPESLMSTGEVDFASKFVTPEEEAISSETRKHIEAAIDKLPELQQKIIKLRYGYTPVEKPEKGSKKGEVSVRQIAKILNKPKSTVERELRDAESKLRKMIKHSNSVMRIMKAYGKHMRIAYVPEKIKKIGSSYLLDERITVNKYSNQFVCSCGQKNCLHKDAVLTFIKQK